MKTKKRLKKNLIILKKERADICFEMGLDYKVIRNRLVDCYKTEKEFKSVIKKVKTKKEFKKALAKKLRVNYSDIRYRFPRHLNSTEIANFLDPHLENLSHEDIRNASQKLKLKFGYN